ALRTMERYLAETGANAVHRSEVETTLETLRARVGKIVLATDANDCEVSVDEQPVGVTPLVQPILVSVGTRKLAVTGSGRPAASRAVGGVAGETVRIDLKLRPPPPAVLRLPPITAPAPVVERTSPKKQMAIGWSVTGVLLAATIGVGA